MDASAEDFRGSLRSQAFDPSKPMSLRRGKPADESRLRRERERAVLLLVVEQPALGRQTAAEAREAAVRADHAMAGHDDRQRVLAVGRTHGARCLRIAELARDRAVVRRLAVWDAQQFEPDALLKIRPLRREWQIESRQLAREIRLQLRS